jgi:aminodeoxyfutalosine synthase
MSGPIEIETCVQERKRITPDQALSILKSDDLLALGRLADSVRRRMNGDKTWYVINKHINHTNICHCHCRFCSFRKGPEHPGAYLLSEEEFLEQATGLEGVSELHTVGGCNPDVPLEYFERLLREIKRRYPSICCKFLSAVEVVDLARREGLEVEEVLTRLKASGLDMLPGGGAEIFSERVRSQICPDKASARQWLDTMETAHRLHIPSNATMLYGHIETEEEIVDHLTRLRDLQDRTGGFLAFVPLPYHPQHNPLEVERGPGAVLGLKIMALSRIFLDNFPHIKAYWISLGIRTAQMALLFGADDLDGTVVQEKIYHDAGSSSPQALNSEDIERLISETGLKPVRRDGFYSGCKTD